MEFIEKNRELQQQLNFLNKNKNFISHRKNYKPLINNNNKIKIKGNSNSLLENFKTNIQIKTNTYSNSDTSNNESENTSIHYNKNPEISNSFKYKDNSSNDKPDAYVSDKNNFFLNEERNTRDSGNFPFQTSSKPISNQNLNEFNLQIEFSSTSNKGDNNSDDSSKNTNEDNQGINKLNNYGSNNNDDGNVNANNLRSSDRGEDSLFVKEKRILRKLKNGNLFGLNYVEFLLKDKYRYAKNIECNKFNCFGPNVCLSESFCKCGEEYANFDETALTIPNSEKTQKVIFCSYKRKKQIITFTLEFFLFFGMGHVYSGNYIIGLSKFLFFTLLILFKLKEKKNPKEADDEDEDNKTKINWLNLVVLLLALIWYLVDIIFLALSRYIDGNGIPMLSW